MATSAQETKDARIEAVVARVRETVEAPEADDVERFLRAYYAHVAPEDLVERSEDELYGAAFAHWSLARLRRAGELKVHVYTPSLEEHGLESPHRVVETVMQDMPFLVDSVSMEVNRQGGLFTLSFGRSCGSSATKTDGCSRSTATSGSTSR